MQDIHFLSGNHVPSPGPQFGACEQMWLVAQTGNQNQQPFATGNNVDVQMKLMKGPSKVCRSKMHCSIDKLTIQELINFCYFVDAIHRELGILTQSQIDDYDAPRLRVLAQCFNMCAR